jgi:Uma2 family endonuclease
VSEAFSAVSFEQFMDETATLQGRFEFVGGRVYAMANATERHDLIAGMLFRRLAGAAEAAGCRAFMADRVVRTRRDAAYVPDVYVVCGRATHPNYEVDALIVVEVLSPSTERVDRTEKAIAYASLPSIEHYVLVDPMRRSVELGAPHDLGFAWTSLGDGDVLDLGIERIDLTELYAQLDRVATT